MKKAGILFPHQLIHEHPIINNCDEIFLIEEFLFFKQIKFHKIKLAFHRASMMAYGNLLNDRKINVTYVASTQQHSDTRQLFPFLKSKGYNLVNYIMPSDDWLERRIKKGAAENNINLTAYENPLFLNSTEDLKHFFKPEKKSFFQTSFYKQQRKKREILIDDEGHPEGGKWTYDSENRKKYPKGKIPPSIQLPLADDTWKEAVHYVNQSFPNNPGELQDSFIYPYSRSATLEWFNQFLEFRFYDFGAYEDAIVDRELILNHSVLTPGLNVGLISPQEIIEITLSYADEHEIPINSTEGFVRQIIGWREFMHGMYLCKGRYMRTKNFWNFNRKIPPSFYNGTTGIEPVDRTIRKVIQYGYCHHIERLMVLGNFMVLCEFDPDDVYKWFMELFIDAYDWVMVPNVYGMSQFADGGTLSTKPYISGSNYIMKMSNYKKGPWQDVWDGLFWRFMHVHRDFFIKNPRLSMLVRNLDKMPQEKLNKHLQAAEHFLEGLD